MCMKWTQIEIVVCVCVHVCARVRMSVTSCFIPCSCLMYFYEVCYWWRAQKFIQFNFFVLLVSIHYRFLINRNLSEEQVITQQFSPPPPPSKKNLFSKVRPLLELLSNDVQERSAQLGTESAYGQRYVCIQGGETNPKCKTRKPDRPQHDLPPPVLSPRSILPLLSSRGAFIPALKNSLCFSKCYSLPPPPPQLLNIA